MKENLHTSSAPGTQKSNIIEGGVNITTPEEEQIHSSMQNEIVRTPTGNTSGAYVTPTAGMQASSRRMGHNAPH
jgi:hypothetical protein